MTSLLLDTIALCKRDLLRRLEYEGRASTYIHCLSIMLKPSVLSIILYRFKRYLLLKKLGFLIKPLSLFDSFYSHNELDARAEIGAGLVLSDLGGTGITRVAILGKNCTFMGRATLALGAIEGINIAHDKIILGDACVIGHNVKVIRPVTIANYVQIEACAVVIKSIITEGSIVSGIPAKTIGVVSPERMASYHASLTQADYHHSILAV